MLVSEVSLDGDVVVICCVDFLSFKVGHLVFASRANHVKNIGFLKTWHLYTLYFQISISMILLYLLPCDPFLISKLLSAKSLILILEKIREISFKLINLYLVEVNSLKRNEHVAYLLNYLHFECFCKSLYQGQ